MGSWPLGLHSDSCNNGHKSLSKREDCFSHTQRNLEASGPGLVDGPIVLSGSRALSALLFCHLMCVAFIRLVRYLGGQIPRCHVLALGRKKREQRVKDER